MAIQSLPQVTCSLNLGLIYSVNYSYTPEEGVSITLSFVNATGIYNTPNMLPMTKVFINIGGTSFSMYPVRWRRRLSSGSRVIDVDFVDETFQLENYYVALTGRGCGARVYTLGRPVDGRTSAQKISQSLDPIATKIDDLTSFPDIEYSFGEFLTVLRGVFNVSLTTGPLPLTPGTIGGSSTGATRGFTGTFREVLNSWCNLYNWSYFFENGVLKIFNPVSMNPALPTVPNDAIEFSESSDITDTYGKTFFSYVQLPGQSFQLSQTSETGGEKDGGSGGGGGKNEGGALYVRTMTLYPLGYEFGLTQTTLPLDQVAAAQYGQEFWFLYNFYKGTAGTECGWEILSTSDSSSLSIVTSLKTMNKGTANVASIDLNIFNEKFEAYYQYGQTIAGKYYLSNAKTDINIDRGYTWFDTTNALIKNFNSDFAKTREIEPNYLVDGPPTDQIKTVEGTEINKYFPGIKYKGDRILIKDNSVTDFAKEFATTNTEKGLINLTYSSLFDGREGSRSMDFSGLGQKQFVGYDSISIPQAVIELFNKISDKTAIFLPKTPSKNITGIRTIDYASAEASKEEPYDIKLVEKSQGPNIIGNVGVIKTIQDGSYTVYCAKYEACRSSASSGGYFGYRFDSQFLSEDSSQNFSFRKLANNTYQVSRDVTLINQLLNQVTSYGVAEARAFPTKTVSFTLNTLRPIGLNFLTNGLVGMSLQVGSNGITASYEFSNSMLRVPDAGSEIQKLQDQIRNSYIRKSQAVQTIR